MYSLQVQCLRSTVLSMAILHNHITPEEGLRASRTEEIGQHSEWGLVEGAHDVTHSDLSVRVIGASLYLNLLKK
jgi:chaperone required for assembly of F1-ATPase